VTRYKVKAGRRKRKIGIHRFQASKGREGVIGSDPFYWEGEGKGPSTSFQKEDKMRREKRRDKI